MSICEKTRGLYIYIYISGIYQLQQFLPFCKLHHELNYSRTIKKKKKKDPSPQADLIFTLVNSHFCYISTSTILSSGIDKILTGDVKSKQKNPRDILKYLSHFSLSSYSTKQANQDPADSIYSFEGQL